MMQVKVLKFNVTENFNNFKFTPEIIQDEINEFLDDNGIEVFNIQSLSVLESGMVFIYYTITYEIINEETYVKVWIHEEEKWYFFKESFDENQFPDGFCAYYVKVSKGRIVNDEYCRNNNGKPFEEAYKGIIWRDIK